VQELRGHAVVGWERVELLHSAHAAVVQWYIAAGRLAQSYSSLAGRHCAVPSLCCTVIRMWRWASLCCTIIVLYSATHVTLSIIVLYRHCAVQWYACDAEHHCAVPSLCCTVIRMWRWASLCCTIIVLYSEMHVTLSVIVLYHHCAVQWDACVTLSVIVLYHHCAVQWYACDAERHCAVPSLCCTSIVLYSETHVTLSVIVLIVIVLYQHCVIQWDACDTCVCRLNMLLSRMDDVRAAGLLLVSDCKLSDTYCHCYSVVLILCTVISNVNCVNYKAW